MPFPSHRCQTCRQRRVKCNESRPKCAQCIKSSRDCTWDDASHDPLPFRSENLFASGAKARRKKRGGDIQLVLELKSTQSSGSDEALEPTAVTHRAARQAPLRPPPTQPLEAEALEHYLRRFFGIQLIRLLSPECLYSYVQPELSHISPDSLLGLSMTAMSLATLGRTRKHPVALSRSHKRYSEALVAMRAAVEDPEIAQTDQCLMATKLLCTYESMVANNGQDWPYSQSKQHFVGSAAILRLRRAHANRHKRNIFLDLVVRRGYLRAAILQALPTPRWMEDGAAFGETGSELEFDRCLVKVAKLRMQSKDLMPHASSRLGEEDDTLLQGLEALVSNALAADKSLLAWSTSKEQSWIFDESPREKDGNIDAGTILAHPFGEVEMAMKRNRWRTCRLVVNIILVRALAACDIFGLVPWNATPLTRLWAHANIQELADDIQASVPYFLRSEESVLQSMREQKWTSDSATPTSIEQCSPRLACFLVFPLAVCIAAEEWLLPTQHRWFKEMLHEVSCITGSATLENIATRQLPDYL